MPSSKLKVLSLFLSLALLFTGLALFGPRLAASIQAGFPVLSRTGNTTEYVTATGAFVNGNCVKTDANHNGVDSGAPCGTGSGSVTMLTWTGGIVSIANPSTTPAFTVAGTSGGVVGFTGPSTWASSIAGTAGHLMLWGGAGATPTDGGAPPVSPTTNQNIRTIGASFGSFQSGATALASAATACVPTYYAGTIQSVEIIGNVSGSATIDVQTVAHSSWTGTASVSSITAADTPALSSAARYTDSTLTGWTTALTAGTDVCFVMSAPTTVAGLSITVKVAAN